MENLENTRKYIGIVLAFACIVIIVWSAMQIGRITPTVNAALAGEAGAYVTKDELNAVYVQLVFTLLVGVYLYFSTLASTHLIATDSEWLEDELKNTYGIEKKKISFEK